MELPQPQRSLGTEGKKPTHDFLSLYSNDSSFQHADPRSTQGFYLKTQDFLQPLERIEKNKDKGEGPPDLSAGRSSSVEHVLPGGIGTYSISHISTFNQSGGKPEKPFCMLPANTSENKVELNKVNSNSSSYSGGAFTLWDESVAVDKGVLKDNSGERQSMRERRAVSVDLPFLANSCFSRTLGEYGAQLSPLSTCNVKVAQSNQGFVDVIKSVKVVPEDDEDEEEEEYLERSRDTKKEGSSQRGDVVQKVDGKTNDQKANTPRSKHSATEQRRRSKINDRFQILRQLVPHSDQKRDKASFLLEVIEYVQLLQEKVQKYEASFQGWNQEKMKMMSWKNSQGPGENSADQSRAKNIPSPGFIFPGKFDDNRTVATVATPTLATNSCNPLESDNTRSVAPYKAKEHHSSLPSKAASVPIPLQPCVYNPVPRSSLAQTQQRLVSDAENMATQPQTQFWQRPWPADRPIQSNVLNEQEELAVEGGVISVSSVYSQGLLDTLTRALQNSGLDLSQANISVQIDLGKRARSRPSTTTSSAKDYEDPSYNNRAMAHSRAASSGGDSEQAHKRPKTERNS